jgi:hydrogenase 3 maturation protease
MESREKARSLSLESLGAYLSPSFHGKVLFLGIGNRLRGDDGAGPEFITRLKEKCDSREDNTPSDAFPVFIDAGESPEDWFIRIVDIAPEIIVVADAIDLQAEPGSIAVVDSEDLPDSLCFSTHRLPLRNLLRLWKDHGSNTVVLAIQPENLGFHQGLSPSVERSIDGLVELLSPPGYG